MPKVRVTRRVHEALRALALNGLDDSQTERNPDGTVTFPVEDDTMERLEVFRFAGESDSDLIERLIAKLSGGGNA